jgi:diphthamide synthase (EF-2-diphthine--ammonia ligase)
MKWESCLCGSIFLISVSLRGISSSIFGRRVTQFASYVVTTASAAYSVAPVGEKFTTHPVWKDVV